MNYPKVLLKSSDTTQSYGGLGYFRVISDPDARITYNNESIVSGQYIFNDTNDQKLGVIQSTTHIGRIDSQNQVLLLAPPKLVIVTSVPKKTYFRTSDEKYYISHEEFANRKFYTEGLYIYNPNEIEVQVVVNKLLRLLIDKRNYLNSQHFNHYSNPNYQLGVDNQYLINIDNEYVQPDELRALFSWTKNSDISLLAPSIDFDDDYSINSDNLILSTYVKSNYYKQEDIDPSYYGVHNSELINEYSNKLYRVIEPADTSGLIVIGSREVTLDLKDYLR